MLIPGWAAWAGVLACGLLLVVLVLLVMVLRQRQGGAGDSRLDVLLANQEKFERLLRADLVQIQRGMRTDFDDMARALRSELAQRQDSLRAELTRDAGTSRRELGETLDRFSDQLGHQVQQLAETNTRRMGELRDTLETRLRHLQADNTERLEAMRQTVDERLHATLEQRLGESFRLVSERLEAVHKGLGEMQHLAAGVGDLKRVLGNVKTRGGWGEMQLARLMADLLAPAQYAANVRPIPGSAEVVEFAVKLPGAEPGQPVWLPLDAKFPKEEYERLQMAREAGDIEAARSLGVAFERVVETEGKRIASKYVAPPHTTDFAILFLATEGLYAEVVGRPELLARLHGLRISVAGPATLAALLNSLQMGFRTLAIEQRSAEVWQVLRGVRTEFDKFGTSLASVKKSLDTASQRLGQTEVRTRAMLRSLRAVEALPESDVATLFDGAAPNAAATAGEHLADESASPDSPAPGHRLE